MKSTLYRFNDTQILACQEVLIRVWPSINRNVLLFLSNSKTTSKHAPCRKKSLMLYTKKPNGKSLGTNYHTNDES